MLEVEDASFGYGVTTIVERLNFSVKRGEALAIIGPNGAGKTTALRGIMGQARPTGGRVILDESATIGHVPQHTNVDPSFPISSQHVVAMGRCLSSKKLVWWPQAEDRFAVSAALEQVGLLSERRTKFGELSGGQRQRIFLARALVSNPQLLLLDEPFNGLDPANRDVLLEILQDLKARGVAIISTTHDLRLAQAVCERTVVVDKRQRSYGPTAEILGEARACSSLRF